MNSYLTKNLVLQFKQNEMLSSQLNKEEIKE